MKKIKLLFIVIIIISIISLFAPNIYASDFETYKISLSVKDNKNEEDINLYILLPIIRLIVIMIAKQKQRND